jgi:excisionase family DNA binding protein
MDRKKDQHLLSTKEAARYLNVSVSFLAKARVSGTGPRYSKLRRLVRYHVDDLDAYRKVNEKTSTSDA